MLPQSPTLAIEHVPEDDPKFPADRMCKSGHPVPDNVRFFAVSGDTLHPDLHGIYCELCLKAAQQRLKFMKQHKVKPVPNPNSIKDLLDFEPGD